MQKIEYDTIQIVNNKNYSLEREMRKIEYDMIQAIVNKKNYSCDNTRVIPVGDVVSVFLHNHNIAKITDKTVEINYCGYSTKTTKSRLNSILLGFCEGVWIYQKDFSWYIGNHQTGLHDLQVYVKSDFDDYVMKLPLLSGEPVTNNSSLFPHDTWVSFPNVILLKSFES